MSDQHTYLIELRGLVNADELNASAPLRVTEVRTAPGSTVMAATTDQAGLIGLLRHWHGLGFQFLSITCESHHQEK